MKITILASLLLLSSTLLAQHGSAPSGYYPLTYTGNTFTGTVVGADPATDAVTLEYKKGSKAESFSVRLEGGCNVPSTNGQRLHASDVPQGTVLTAFYMPIAEKRDGKGDGKKDDAGKERLYGAIGISFVEWRGKKISEDHRAFYPCGTATGPSHFRFW